MKKYKFRYRKYMLITKYVINELLRVPSGGTTLISLDLGRSFIKARVTDGVLVIGNLRFGLDYLKEEVTDETGIYILSQEGVRKIAFYADGKYYKLRLVKPYVAPTLEINGIHMHRIKDITPWEDARLKVKAAKVKRGAKVLDIGTGLGYTAINSLNYGASKVVTIEVDPNVLKMAELNPWSRELEDSRIEIVLGDAYEVIKEFDNEEFDRIIHDPPRIHMAGHLYSLEFYKELYRVLKKGGIMYHYTGAPGIVHGHDVTHGIIRRLSAIGFVTEKNEKLLGVICRKY
ncbi:MAG TPA: methyltransferase domain-containing protein [Acidilobales archaeon]|nr:methyltransferase domain-containing protein [Acidilobales archaeon]